MYLSKEHSSHSNVTHLLAEAVHSKTPSYCNGIHAYFPVKDMPGYALRLDNGALRNHCTPDIFKYDSCLTPPHYVLLGPAVGQTLLKTKGDNAAIVAMPAGHSLEYFFHRGLYGKNSSLSHFSSPEMQERHLATATKLMKELLAPGDSKHIETNPFVPLFERAYELAYLGYQPDLCMKNLFYDRKEKTLSLFHDFSERTTFSPTDTYFLKSALNKQCSQAANMFAAKFAVSAESDDYKSTLEVFQHAMESAKKHVLDTHLGKHVPSSFAFANTQKIEGVGLKNPPYALAMRIRDIEDLHSTQLASR